MNLKRNSSINIDLTDKVAIVTGASQGIGKAIAQELAAAGATVVLAARSEEKLKNLAKEVNGIAYPCDITEEAEVLSLFEMVQDELGGCDILVNNAGLGIYGPTDEFDVDDFDKIQRVNVRGTFLCSREAAKLMKFAGSGYIINISSVVGIKGYVEQAAYGASKHAVMGLTKTMATELQPEGVRVSAILPGGVDTEMVALSRPDLDRSILIKPADIAHSVMFLLSLPESCAVDQIYIRRRNSSPF